MYHVEELPDASSALTPGWTYVPDTGFDPAQAAIAPSLGRKRGVRDPARGDLSSRQKNAIVRHLAELDRENHRDVAIPVKAREGRSTALPPARHCEKDMHADDGWIQAEQQNPPKTSAESSPRRKPSAISSTTKKPLWRCSPSPTSSPRG
jgi:zinc finger HIT domain-containing protein 1